MGSSAVGWRKSRRPFSGTARLTAASQLEGQDRCHWAEMESCDLMIFDRQFSYFFFLKQENIGIEIDLSEYNWENDGWLMLMISGILIPNKKWESRS